MSVYRYVHTNYWQDDFILSLTPEEKFFYVYLLTNSKTKQCGIYELSKKVMVFETGYNIETINKLASTSRELIQEFGEEPSPEQLAERMNLSIDNVRGVVKIAQHPISLEAPVGDEGDTHFGDFIEDKSIVSPSDATSSVMLKEQLEEVLVTLTEREAKILRLRFGLNNGYPHTLEEVGNVFHVTRERIRQIEAKALKKLCHPIRSRKLKGFLEVTG